MRVTAMVLLFLAGDVWAASEGGSTGRMDFANTPAFHSVFENRVASASELSGRVGCFSEDAHRHVDLIKRAPVSY